MDFKKTTESDSHYHSLEKMSVEEILISINKEDQTVALSIKKSLPQINKLTTVVSEKLLELVQVEG
jgi:N-acetylmuramic acid 6-phosphate etherase